MKKMNTKESTGYILNPASFDKQIKPGAFSLESMKAHYGPLDYLNWKPTIWIPEDKSYPMQLEISNQKEISMFRYENKYVGVPFYIPRGEEKEYADCFASLDVQFEAGEIDQKQVEKAICEFTN